MSTDGDAKTTFLPDHLNEVVYASEHKITPPLASLIALEAAGMRAVWDQSRAYDLVKIAVVLGRRGHLLRAMVAVLEAYADRLAGPLRLTTSALADLRHAADTLDAGASADPSWDGDGESLRIPGGKGCQLSCHFSWRRSSDEDCALTEDADGFDLVLTTSSLAWSVALGTQFMAYARVSSDAYAASCVIDAALDALHGVPRMAGIVAAPGRRHDTTQASSGHVWSIVRAAVPAPTLDELLRWNA